MNYYELEVVLHSGAFLPKGWAPGRVFAVPGTCRLSELGPAIDAAFGRWDLGHERDFRVKGRRLDGGALARGASGLTLDSLGLAAGDSFEYEFDLGDSWLHRCLVRNAAPDLDQIWEGWRPQSPATLLGWGSLPDQYGRETESDDGSADE